MNTSLSSLAAAAMEIITRRVTEFNFERKFLPRSRLAIAANGNVRARIAACVLTRIQQLISDFDARLDEATTIARIRGKMSEFANYHARPRHPEMTSRQDAPAKATRFRKYFRVISPRVAFPQSEWKRKATKQRESRLQTSLAESLGPPDQDPPERYKSAQNNENECLMNAREIGRARRQTKARTLR